MGFGLEEARNGDVEKLREEEREGEEKVVVDIGQKGKDKKVQVCWTDEQVSLVFTLRFCFVTSHTRHRVPHNILYLTQAPFGLSSFTLFPSRQTHHPFKSTKQLTLSITHQYEMARQCASNATMWDQK